MDNDKDDVEKTETKNLVVIEGPIIRKKKRGKGWLEINVFDEQIDKVSTDVWIQTRRRRETREEENDVAFSAQQEEVVPTEMFFVQSIIQVSAYQEVVVDPSKTTPPPSKRNKWIGQSWKLIQCSPNIEAIPLVWNGIIQGMYPPSTLLLSDHGYDDLVVVANQQSSSSEMPPPSPPQLSDTETSNILVNIQNHRRWQLQQHPVGRTSSTITAHLHLLPPPPKAGPRKRVHVRRLDLRLLEYYENVGSANSGEEEKLTTTGPHWKLFTPQYVPIMSDNNNGLTVPPPQNLYCQTISNDSPAHQQQQHYHRNQFSQRRLDYLAGKKRPQISWMIQRITQLLNSKETGTSSVRSAHPNHILDVGGGRGDLAIALAIAFPSCRITVVDKNTSSLNAGKLSAIEILGKEDCHNRMDFIEEDFTELVNRRKNSGNSIIHNNDTDDLNLYTVDWVVALHACGDLSDLALDFAKEYACSFLLCPCCYTKRYCYAAADNARPPWTNYAEISPSPSCPSVIETSSSVDDDVESEEIAMYDKGSGSVHGENSDVVLDDPSVNLGRLAELSEAPEVSKRAMTIINSMRLTDFTGDRTAVAPTRDQEKKEGFANDDAVLHLEEYDSQCSGRNIVMVGATPMSGWQ